MMASGVSSGNSTRSYDPNIVIQAANSKLAAGDLQGGQTLFQSALLTWVDDAREGASIHADSLREAIATLWIAYAQYLQSAKQYKSATEAFEQAVTCPIGSTIGRVWLEYARFLQDRNKPASAQKVFMRALGYAGDGPSSLSVQSSQDQYLLWQEFLELSRTTSNNPSLTLTELQQAIQEESANESSMASPASKRARLAQSAVSQTSGDDDMPVSRTHVVTPTEVDLELQTLTESLQAVPNDPTFMAAWLVRDGNAPPQPPAYPLFEPAPPKLSDPTGKELLGESLALAVVERLLEPSGPVVLQVCRALWLWNLLQEQNSKKSVDTIDSTIVEDYGQLQARLDERLSVAGAAESAVRTMNQMERQAFESKAQEERQNLFNTMAWEQRQFQWSAQQVLAKLRIPGFDTGATVDDREVSTQARVCAYLHSAFFLQQRIGATEHQKMLKTQRTRLEQFVQAAAASNPTTGYPPVAGGNNHMMMQGNKYMGGGMPPNMGYDNYPQGAGGGMGYPPPPPNNFTPYPPPNNQYPPQQYR
eukprot:Nitzschia sp. Nitz4//scaffold175_size95217//87336//88934//NITZ4_004739-RA/size95217-processed-gene-0.60-mRNA-1//1//CDS//3329538987//5174//frame0